MRIEKVYYHNNCIIEGILVSGLNGHLSMENYQI